MSGGKEHSWKIVSGLLLVGIVSGSAFTFTKVLVDEMTAVSLVQGRLATAAFSVLAVMVLRGTPVRVTPSIIGRVSVLALLDGLIPYLLISWAAGSVDAAVAAVLVSTMPLFTALLATVTLRDERLALTGALGIAAGIAGVAVLAGPDAFDIEHSSGLGLLAIVAACASYGAGTVYARVLLRSGDPVTLTGLKLAAAAVILTPVTVAGGGAGAFVSLSPQGWACLAALGVGATGLGRCVYLWIVRAAGSVRASLVTYITPIVGVFLGWAVFNERIGFDIIGGGALIVCGVASVMFGGQLRLPRLTRGRIGLSRAPGDSGIAVAAESS